MTGKLKPESPIFDGKNHGFRLRFSLKPIHWKLEKRYPSAPPRTWVSGLAERLRPKAQETSELVTKGGPVVFAGEKNTWVFWCDLPSGYVKIAIENGDL